jgi:hypothetical protein
MPYTKKQLEEKFNLAKSTLHERLRDCGLDTKKREYTDEEIDTIFSVADDMIKAGRSREDIRRHFGVQETDARQENTQHPPTSAPPGGNIFMDAMAQATKAYIETEAREGVRQMLPLIPSIIEREFIALIQSGEFHQAFVDYEENVRKPRRADYYDVTAYTVSNVGGLGAGEEDDDDNEEEFIDEETGEGDKTH